MVKFPKHFVQLDKIPGYYWHTEEEQLYSIKIGGVLRKMTFHKGYYGPTRFGFVDLQPGYHISQKGRKRVLTRATIKKLVAEAPEKQKVPVES